MQKHSPLMIGIVFAIVALILGFTIDSPTSLERRLEICTWALAAGGIVTEMPSALGIEWDLSKKIAVGVAGTVVAFVILFLLVKAK